MNWKETIESKKIQLLVALLLLLVLICASLVRACGGPSNEIDQDNILSDGDAPVTDGSYIATVTYVVNFPDSGEEPITFVLQAASDGKALIIPEVEDTDDTVWSGWFTEDGEPFDFDTVLTRDTTICCSYYDDLNNNEIADGTADDPITVYQFLNLNGAPMFTQKLFGLGAEFDYSAPEYAFPQGPDDGYVFLGWTESRSVSEDGGVMTVALTPELASDRNNNDLVDGSAEDPYVYHIFLAQDGSMLEEIRWLSGEDPVKTDEIACPTTTKQRLVGWNREESKNEAGNTVYTYTPKIVEG